MNDLEDRLHAEIGKRVIMEEKLRGKLEAAGVEYQRVADALEQAKSELSAWQLASELPASEATPENLNAKLRELYARADGETEDA
jgi:hypothetical protein